MPIRYLVGETSPPENTLSLTAKNYLAILAEQLNSTLPMTLSKINLVHYGPHVALKGLTLENIDLSYKQPFYALPYHLGKPSLSSRFASPLEILNLSIQTWLLSESLEIMLAKEINFLNSKLKLIANPVSKRKILDRYRPYLLNKETIGTNDQIRQVALMLKNDPKGSIQLLKHQMVRSIKKYIQMIHTNAQVYSLLFKRVQGFSGTLWNKDTFPEVFDPNKTYPSDTLTKTIYLLLAKNPHEVTFLDETKASLSDKVDDVLRAQKDSSIIDLAGHFKGIQRKLVAEELLKKSSKSIMLLFITIMKMSSIFLKEMKVLNP